MVRQSFSHGRSKQVVVEKIKRRTHRRAPEAKPEPAPVEAPKAKVAAPEGCAGARGAESPASCCAR